MGISFFSGNFEMVMLGAVAGLAVLLLVVLILLIVTMVKLKKLTRRHQDFTRGKDAESLEEVMLSRFDDIDALKRAEAENRKKLK